MLFRSLGEEEVIRRIAARFGDDVIDADGHVRRRAVADRVFGPTPAHAEALAWLESLVHPRVRERILARLAEMQAEDERARRQGGHGPVVVLDVPLLVQAGWVEACDRVVMVRCEEAVRLRRLAERRWTPVEQAAREAAWDRKYTPPTLPPEKIATVDTSGDLAYTDEIGRAHV